MSEERWITWVEPYGPNNEPVYMFVSEKTAVEYAKHEAFITKKFSYATDADALDEFMVVHWAFFTEKPKGVK